MQKRDCEGACSLRHQRNYEGNSSLGHPEAEHQIKEKEEKDYEKDIFIGSSDLGN
jgi:hypothetical protein